MTRTPSGIKINKVRPQYIFKYMKFPTCPARTCTQNMDDQEVEYDLKFSSLLLRSGSQILGPWLGDTVDYWLWHRVVIPSVQAGAPMRQPYAMIDFISQSRTKNLASGHLLSFSFISYLLSLLFTVRISLSWYLSPGSHGYVYSRVGLFAQDISTLLYRPWQL